MGECFAGPSPDCLGEPQPPIEHAFCGPDVDNTYCIFDDYFSGYCIVGESFHGYLRSPDGSSFTTIDAAGAFYTYAKGVNGAGQIVGRFEPGGAEVAFRRDTDGSFTTIDVPGACCSGAKGSTIQARSWATLRTIRRTRRTAFCAALTAAILLS